MRRMLDPKELGGGGGGTRHAYRIVIDSSCWFLSFTEKDYGYKIGEMTDIPGDFFTNANYQDLLSEGFHPAGGYYNANDADMLASKFKKGSTGYFISGYKVSEKRTLQLKINIESRVVNIVQLS